MYAYQSRGGPPFVARGFWPRRCPGRRPSLRCETVPPGRFAAWLAAPHTASGIARLLSAGRGGANELVLGWRTELVASGAAPATVARMLAAIRSLVKAARLVGLVAWQVEVSSPRVRAYRDTAGSGFDGVRRLLAAARVAQAT